MGVCLLSWFSFVFKKKKKVFKHYKIITAWDDSHITQYLKLFHSTNTCRTFSPTYCRKWQPLMYLQLLSFIHLLSSYCFWIISQIQTYLDLFSKFLFFIRLFHLSAFLSPFFVYSILFPLFFFCSHTVIPRTFPCFLSIPFYIIFTV